MELARQQRLDLNYQLTQLERIRQGLQDMMTFVEDQSEKIKNEQELIAKLTKERSDLEPVLRAERQVVDQILSMQEQRARRQQWLGYAGAFVIGVLSSMVASLLISLARSKRKDKQLESVAG